MNNDSKQRNVIVTIFLWLTIMANIVMTVSYIVEMYATNAIEETLGLGLCSMFTLTNILGVILLLRWNKYGLGLISVSIILLSIVYAYVLNLGPIPIIPFIGVIVLLCLILQIRKGGKSAWSQLKSGWDSKHCRHIYQIFAAIELILFILTLIAFGDNNGKQLKPEPIPVLCDTIVIEKQNPDHKASIEILDKNRDIPEKSSKNYSIDDAARYLDTHKVWKESEMSQYPDLRNLNDLMIRSLHTCRDRLPYELTSKSKRLHEISILLRKVEHLTINSDKRLISNLIKKMSHRDISSDELRPYQICESLKEILGEARRYDRMKKSSEKESVKDKPSNEKQVKKRSIGDNSPQKKEDFNTKAVRKKRKQLDEYMKKASDSIKNAASTFTLR